MYSLRESLEKTPTIILRGIASFWETDNPEESGRPRLVDGLLEQMGRADVVRQILRRLGDEEREVLRLLLASGGQIQAPRLTRSFGPLRSPQLAPAAPAELNAVEKLHRKGLLFRALAAMADWQGAVFYIPRDLLPFLPRVPQVAVEDHLRSLDDQTVLPTPPFLFLHRDVAVLLAVLHREHYVLANEGQWSEDLVTALEAFVSAPHPAYRSILLAMAWQAHLFSPDFEGILRPTAEGKQWMRAPRELRSRVLFEAWRHHPTWDDLAGIPALEVEHLWPPDPVRPRQRLLRHLASAEAGSWFSVSDLSAWIESCDPEFLRSTGAANQRPQVRLQETGERLAGPASWKQVEGRYLDFLVAGPLHWLGVVELGQVEGSLVAFRLTPLSQFLWYRDVAPPELSEESIIVEGTFEVWVPVEASPYIIFVLEGCAERLQQDHVSHYRLTREALHWALGRGLRVDDLLDLLARYGRGEVPQNVAYTLEEWTKTYGQLRLHQPLLLSAEDALLLEEVLADTEVRSSCGDPLSSTSVEVLSEHAFALVQRLGRLGYLPKVEEGLLVQGKRFSLTLTQGEAAALLALLWAWEEHAEKGKLSKILGRLAEGLAGKLPKSRLAWARQRQERWKGQLPGEEKSPLDQP
jgi:hypothetical protein